MTVSTRIAARDGAIVASTGRAWAAILTPPIFLIAYFLILTNKGYESSDVFSMLLGRHVLGAIALVAWVIYHSKPAFSAIAEPRLIEFDQGRFSLASRRRFESSSVEWVSLKSSINGRQVVFTFRGGEQEVQNVLFANESSASLIEWLNERIGQYDA